MVASRLLYGLIIAGAIPFVVSLYWPAAVTLGYIFDLALVVALLADFALTPRPVVLTGKRAVGERLSIGRSNPVELELVNCASSDLRCRVKDDYPRQISADTQEFEFTVPKFGKATLRYALLPGQRGSFHFGDINIRYLGRLGLIWRTCSIPAGQDVKVYPDLKALHDLSIKLSHSSELGELHQRRRGQGTDFASLREYMIGDDTRSIDWKATARRDRPVLRTYEAEQEQHLLILIDAGRMMVSDLEGLSRFDHALNSALCLALAGLASNDQVGLGIFADRPLIYLPARRGKGQLKRIVEAVFDIRPKMVEPDYVGVLAYFASAQKGRSLMVVVTDLIDPTGSQTLLAGLASLSPRHLPFCVTLKDRQIEQVAADTGLSPEGIYRRAVALDLLAQRDLALSVLTRRGCLVLDCPPQELSSQLVDRYLEIKSRARL